MCLWDPTSESAHKQNLLLFLAHFISHLPVCSLNSNYLPSAYLFAHNYDPSWRLQFPNLCLLPLFLIKDTPQFTYSLLSPHQWQDDSILMQQVCICTNISKWIRLYISREKSSKNSYWVLFVYTDERAVGFIPAQESANTTSSSILDFLMGLASIWVVPLCTLPSRMSRRWIAKRDEV